ncbi:proline-rich transmembrane protein 4-like [Paramacrobiotus metropolitanus]|uniref:proline-rich transmembrane protein 4-like n=1 Tax=Paramacrobiotus metropolitanus TaxID=2943436 RepID=UPI002445E679|nr:proline-rich transmembrane protein 4-like [Paramacrobiotus metropolitanus]
MDDLGLPDMNATVWNVTDQFNSEHESTASAANSTASTPVTPSQTMLLSEPTTELTLLTSIPLLLSSISTSLTSYRQDVIPSTAVPLPSTLHHPSLLQPSPGWVQAKAAFGWTWDLHIYALGSLFAVVALYSFLCIIQLCRMNNTKGVRLYFSLLHFLIFLFGTSRAVFLLLDPYNHKNLLPQMVAAVFLHLSFPCLTSAFCMVLAALVRTTKMKLMKAGIMNTYLLLGILLGNFAFAISAEIVVDVFLSTQKINAVAVASQTYFIAWSLGLGLGYLVMFGRLVDAARDADGLVLTGTRRVAVAVKMMLAIAMLLLCFAGLHVYGLIRVYGFLKDLSDLVDPWEWYGFHVGTRITELVLAALLAFVASLTIWTKAARQYNIPPPLPPSRVVKEEGQAREGLLSPDGMRLQSIRNPPPSPGIVPKNRRDFPVTFNPEGGKGDDSDFFLPQRFVMANRARSGVARKVDSHLLETNPIHNADEYERYG